MPSTPANGQLDRLRFENPVDFGRWQEYVQARGDTHCTDLGEWRLLFRQLYGIENHNYAYLEQGRTCGVLSLYHICSPFLGRMLVTCPFFGYGGFYWESDAARDALLTQAEATARELGVDYVEFRLKQKLPAPYRANTGFAEFNLELADTPEQTWSDQLSSNARQNIRKSRTHDLRFRLSPDHGPCYDMLRRTLRSHGTPFHGVRFFELLNLHLSDHVRYSEIWHEDRLVAGGVVIRYKDTIITPYIGSLARFRSLRPNYLLYWSLIEHCSADHVARFEMGRSPRNSTHAQFKKKWGCDEMQLFYNYRVFNETKGYRSVSDPTPLQRLAARVWRNLPLALTSAIGPRLFRYIP